MTRSHLQVLANAVLGTVVANLLLARAALLTSPLVVVVGLSLSIPLAMTSDVLRHRAELSASLLCGGLSVWVAFLGVSASGPATGPATAGGGLLGSARRCCRWPCRR